MLQPRKIFENFGLSLAIASDCSYNVCPQIAIVSALQGRVPFARVENFKVGMGSMIEIKPGLDLPIKGSPRQEIGEAEHQTCRVAWV